MKPAIKAKTLSLFSKTLALIVALTGYFIQTIKNGSLPSTDEAGGLVFVCLFIAGVFVPVDMSLIVRNWKGIGRDETRN